MKNLTKITLSNMEFHAFHGCLPHEKALGNQFLVSVTFYFDSTAAQKSDNLNDTVNYQQIYDTIKTEMNYPSNLLENVAHRIICSLKNKFLEIEKWEIELSKLNPPLGGKVQQVTFAMGY